MIHSSQNRVTVHNSDLDEVLGQTSKRQSGQEEDLTGNQIDGVLNEQIDKGGSEMKNGKIGPKEP